MNYSVLEKSSLFSGVPAKELHGVLEAVPHHIQRYDKGETIFHLMEDADRIGIILEGRRHYSGGTSAGTEAIPEWKPNQCFNP